MADIRTAMVTFPSNGAQATGYLVRPEGDEPRPGIVVIQEWWGLVDHIKDVAERFAHEGFVALAPDLYDGRQSEEPDDARKLAMEMDRAVAMRNLQAAAAYLRSLGCPRIGAAGYCMGGGLVWEMATRPGVIDAAAPYYGRPIAPERAGEVNVPVEAFYAELDHGIPPDSVRQVVAALQSGGKDADLHVYEGADHAFFNDSRPDSYHADASADAWRRTLTFFRRTLG
ncbi:MAG: dienelactone hydrolase family protein [Dehalococcoidia bacterium]